MPSEQQEAQVPQYVDIPEKETLVVTEKDILELLGKDRPIKFTADEQRLRYVVDVEVVEDLCAREGCDEVPIFEHKNGDEYCSPACMEADS